MSEANSQVADNRLLGRGRSAGLSHPPSEGRTERSLCGRYPPQPVPVQ